tara:strand:+ start:459 stop:1268 length:810 start_codon:yes stop_codon:yes gene_type:complete
MVSDPKFNTAKDWFEKLKDNLINVIQTIDKNEFEIIPWDHKSEGGGIMSKINGNIIEKGGVNVSTVSGVFNEKMRETIPGAKEDPNFKATGISVVLHPLSPKIPSMHFNTRFLKTSQEWFGGGMDITPSLKFSEEDKYHSSLEKICNRYDKSYYPKYKKWCDDYFFLKHRNEARGAGGIFFDYLQTGDWGKDFEFVQDVGLYFQNFVKNTLLSLKDEQWNSDDKEIQLKKRSRYAEFNLLYDRGTKFGLETGGNIDAILMSMPPVAKWD